MTKDELIAALGRATGPDKDLDFEIVKLLVKSGIISASPLEGIHSAPLRFTSSRDAMLPGAEKLHVRIWAAQLSATCEITRDVACQASGFNYIGEAATEPLARRIAEIKALVKE